MRAEEKFWNLNWREIGRKKIKILFLKSTFLQFFFSIFSSTKQRKIYYYVYFLYLIILFFFHFHSFKTDPETRMPSTKCWVEAGMEEEEEKKKKKKGKYL